jgi:hypothetical protein
MFRDPRRCRDHARLDPCADRFLDRISSRAAMRGLGAPGMALSMIVLLYIAGRFGYETAGPIGAAVPVVLFLAVEAYLFRATRSLP